MNAGHESFISMHLSVKHLKVLQDILQNDSLETLRKLFKRLLFSGKWPFYT